MLLSERQQISKKGTRYDFYIDVITRKPKQVLAAIKKWCRVHGFGYAKPLCKYTRQGLSYFSIFSSFFNDQTFIILDVDTKEAYDTLLETLRKIDKNIHIDTQWGLLERYVQIKAKIDKLESDLEVEAKKIEEEPEIHQTVNFDKAEEMLHKGSKKELKKYFSIY